MSVGNNPNKAEAPDKPVPSGSGKSVNTTEQSESMMEFLAATWQEFRKISWPSREQVVQETWSVIVLVAAFTIVVLAFDWAVAKVVFEPLDKFAKHSGGGVGMQTQNWGNTNQPNVPLNQPGVPGNAPQTPLSLPLGKLNPATSTTTATTTATPGTPEPASPAAPLTTTTTSSAPATTTAPAQSSTATPAPATKK